MKLNCIKISINANEFCSEVTFSEKEDLGAESENMSVDEIIESIGRYLLLQRSYAEDDFDNDYIYYETQDENFAGKLTDYEMALSKNSFELKLKNGEIEIQIKPSVKEYLQLKEILPILTNNSKNLIINN
ncbi:hypothetical protein [Maribacter sp. IgM3_T14_3]|uniref:hypothetical protein n=1 Tax=Maribacter sp. IgM3_T14_3 TaxID=3415140 RepID=UPI003C701437